MKAKWLGLALVSAAVVTGCGEGRAIFNVDLYSFLKGTGSDTVPYFALPGFSADTASPPRKVNLPGAGSSIGLQVYLAADSLGTYKPSALAINVPSKSVSGTNTTRDTIRVDLSAAFDSLFTKSQLWIRFGASVSNPGATTLQGKAVLASLLLTVIIKDKFF